MNDPAPQTEITLALVAGKLVMVMASAGERVAVTMTPREADHLASRLRKAASDTRAAKARQA